MSTQNTDLLKLLKKQSVTPFDALSIGIYRLSARIYELRCLGHNIITIKKEVKTKRGHANVAEYKLIKGKKS